MHQSDRASLYEILGCDNTSTTDQIIAEYKARVLAVHPDKVEASQKEMAEKRFQQLTLAKEMFCDPAKRQHYDLYLVMGQSMGVSLDEWMENREKVQQTLHWAHLNEKTPMIRQAPEEEVMTTPTTAASSCKQEIKDGESCHVMQYPRRFHGWTSHNTPVLNAFRRYEI